MREGNGQFQKGVSGNPSGRPPGPTLSSKIRAALDKPDLADPTITCADRMIQTAIDKACRGDFRYFLALLERIEGRVTERVKFESAQDSPLDKFNAEQLRGLARKFVFGAEELQPDANCIDNSRYPI